MLHVFITATFSLALVAAQGCGVSPVRPAVEKKVAGQIATPGSWPWMIMLVDGMGFIAGGGVIVDKQVVVTSAQHFESPGLDLIDLQLGSWRIYTGKNNLSGTDPNESYNHIRRIMLHADYNATTLENDVAIIILDETIKYNDHTLPCCLPDSSVDLDRGQQCYMAGWGSTSSTGNEETLNQLVYPVLDDAVCSNIWTDFLPDTEICAGYINATKGFCGNDVGSPLMCMDVMGAWHAIGLASSGGNCRQANRPGVFLDLSQYNDWILKTMKEAGYPYQYTSPY